MVLKIIKQRRSVREFKDKKVSKKAILEIIKAGQFAPSARNNRGVEFIVIENQKTKEKIFQVVGQEFVKKAPVLIIPVTDRTKTNCPVEDLAVASENMMLQATALKLGSVWKAVKKGQESEIKKILGIPENFILINIIPIGFPKKKPLSHSEKEFELKKVHFEKW